MPKFAKKTKKNQKFFRFFFFIPKKSSNFAHCFENETKL